MSKITKDDISYIAELSRLKLTETEIEKFQTEISRIIDYVEQLQDADLDGLDITHQVSGQTNQTRADGIANKDVAENSLQRVSKAQLLENAGDTTEDGYIKADRVL